MYYGVDYLCLATYKQLQRLWTNGLPNYGLAVHCSINAFQHYRITYSLIHTFKIHSLMKRSSIVIWF